MRRLLSVECRTEDKMQRLDRQLTTPKDIPDAMLKKLQIKLVTPTEFRC